MTEQEKAPAIAGALLPHRGAFPTAASSAGRPGMAERTRLAVYEPGYATLGLGEGHRQLAHGPIAGRVDCPGANTAIGVGVWRLIGLFDGFVSCSVLVNSSIYRHCRK